MRTCLTKHSGNESTEGGGGVMKKTKKQTRKKGGGLGKIKWVFIV